MKDSTITMNPEILLESISLRQDLCKEENTSVLDRVGQLVMLPDTGFATTEQVAHFYGVTENNIFQLVFRNKEEFKRYGYKILQKKEITDLQNVSLLSLFKSRSKNVALFPRPAILLCGCLLRDSEVARLVRNYLITVEQAISPSMREKIWQIVDKRMVSISQQIATIDQQIATMHRQIATMNQKMDDLKQEVHDKLEESKCRVAMCRSEIKECREDVGDLKNWVTGLEQTMSDWDAYFQQLACEQNKSQTSTQNPITREQAAMLKQKVREIGNALRVWRDFKKRFSISRYTLLPANRWEDALQWLEQYPSRERGSTIQKRTRASKRDYRESQPENGISRW